jgi:hypothetical protein
MIPALNEIWLSLYGAWRLAWRDAAGIGFFDASQDGVARSFFAAVLVAPAYALMLALRFAATPAAPDPLRFALAESIAYVLSWIAFPLAMVSLTRAVGRFDRWPLFVAACNWSLVVQNALILPIAVASSAGLLPPAIGGLLWLPLLAFLIAYAWFIARTALDVPASTAFAIVGLDFLLSFLIDATADALH